MPQRLTGEGVEPQRQSRGGIRHPTIPKTDLRTKLVARESNWDLRPLPEPATDSPSESLARILKRTGLALEGVEVVAAP